MPPKRSLPVKKIGYNLTYTKFKDIKEFYRIEIYYLILDRITQAIKDKFNENDLKILNSINNILVNKNLNVSDIQEVRAVYGFDVNELMSKIIVFNRMFINVFKLFLTVPMNSASCERSSSCLRRLKIYLRTTMDQINRSNLKK
ncbi:Hypothetical protein CINCED_3A007779 [Cinara cedri]|uniref:HAT, C-terminal dimerisation domain n=1 Tax=Cinara cedri TaxID=506608 RepID=A0A5E4ML49_9HEMI|nr:Hypothetical protein CINCED_3A007779 [Cinara cedri]